MGDERGTRVYVGNLTDKVKKEQLDEEFSRFGKLNSVWIAHNPPGFAFIEFANKNEAESACDSLNGQDLLGSKLRVEISKGRSRPGGRGGPRGGGGRFGDRPGGRGGGGFRSNNGGGDRRSFGDRGPRSFSGGPGSRGGNFQPRDNFRAGSGSRPGGDRPGGRPGGGFRAGGGGGGFRDRSRSPHDRRF